ncbi:MAG: MerR family transcriptional regulator [Proteobacteria bacterium]|nr:MerR family transcriptional regulator [Pseudomonadota bacterium]
MDDLYRIGATAKLTGVAVERLRAWERRYGLIPAHRTGKTRFYSSSQIERLTLMRQLVESGHAISSLVDLSDEQLGARLTVNRQAEPERGGKVGLIGANLIVLESRFADSPQIDIAARWSNVDAFLSDQDGVDTLDVVVLQMPVLMQDPVDEILDFYQDARIIPIYQYATDTVLASFMEQGLTPLRWPVSWHDIEHACVSSGGLPLKAARTAPRKFTDEQLIAIAASHSEEESGCAGHVVELITTLNAFAEYSLDYSERSADLNRYERLHAETTQARAQLELALSGFLEAL